MKFSIVILLFTTLVLEQALAQFSSTLPKKPVLHRASAFSSWTVTFQYEDEEVKQVSGTPPIFIDRLKQVTITKTNKTYHEVTLWESGKKEEKWIFDGYQLRTLPGTTTIVPILAPSSDPEVPVDPGYSDYSRCDFEGLGWVSSGNYQGTKIYDGKSAYLFETKDPKSGLKLAVYLSVETQLPLSFSDGVTTRIYTYNSPPTDPLIPPKRFLDVIAAHQRGVAALHRHSDGN